MQDQPTPLPKDRTDAPDQLLGHAGELEMRRRFPSSYCWDEYSLPAMIRSAISPALARFIEAQPFFFIATADAEGHCDASFRGCEHDTGGHPLPALKVMDERRLIFPDYAGNGLYNSLGNIFVNPHIGMLFVDFAHPQRARINGLAAVVEASDDVKTIWPQAQAAIVVTIEQAYANCPARIPRLHNVTGR